MSNVITAVPMVTTATTLITIMTMILILAIVRKHNNKWHYKWSNKWCKWYNKNIIESVIVCHAGSSGTRYNTAWCESIPQAQGYTCSSSQACSGHEIRTSPGSICTADAWQSTGCYAYRQETETDSAKTAATARYAHCLHVYNASIGSTHCS